MKISRALLGVALAASLILPACAPTSEGPPPPVCVESHVETDMGKGVGVYMLTGSMLVGYVASQETVCDKWEDPSGKEPAE